jgi:hypothetical protein
VVGDDDQQAEDLEEDQEKDGLTSGIKGWRKLSKEMTEWRRITKKAKTHIGL